MTVIEGVVITQLKQIKGDKGSVIHGLRKDDPGYAGFGEAYFSTVYCNNIKGWKKHTQMTLNIVVITGEIKFVLYDEREKINSQGRFLEVGMSFDSYQRLTIPPGVWVAFEGMADGMSTLLNIASIPHDPDEQIDKLLNEIEYSWSKL